MIFKKLGEWLLSQHLHAGLVAFACIMLEFIGLPTSIIASVIVALVTLRRGAVAGLAVLMWVALPAIAYLLIKEVTVFDALWLRSVLVWLLALVLRSTSNWNYVILAISVMAILILSCVHLYDPLVHQKWSSIITAALAELFQKSGEFSINMSQLQLAIKSFSYIATGVFSFVIMCTLFLKLLLARFWQSVMFNPGGLRAEINDIRVGKLISLVFPLAILAVYLSKSLWLIDCLPVLAFAFVISGFVYLHIIARKSIAAKFCLLLAYILSFFIYYLVCLWALLGFVRTWLKLPFDISNQQKGVL